MTIIFFPRWRGKKARVTCSRESGQKCGIRTSKERDRGARIRRRREKSDRNNWMRQASSCERAESINERVWVCGLERDGKELMEAKGSRERKSGANTCIDAYIHNDSKEEHLMRKK